jgi:transcriptional regulator with GAF, ATPase, and Fis domain
VLQSRLISRVGGEKAIPVDVRIIAATNRDLRRMVHDKQFREDLWFRLNVFPITVPPLRYRKEDIPAFVRHFVVQKSRGLNIAVPPAIEPSAYERLMCYNWPGNVRELENIVERELICYREGELRFDCPFMEEISYETVQDEAELPGAPIILDKAISAHIKRTLEMTNGKIHGHGGAAELLGINPNTLRSRMRKLGMLKGRDK